MTEIYTYRNFAYLDTNILSYLAKKVRDKEWSEAKRFRSYLLDQDLTIAISEAHMLELSEADKLHEPLALLLVMLPSALIKSREMIVAEEVDAHPSPYTGSIVAQRINPLLLEPNGITILKRSLFSKSHVTEARNKQQKRARELPQEHQQLKSNYPTARNGKYVKEQAKEFANFMVMQILAGLHREFLLQFKDDISQLKFENFRGIRLRSMALFYKYYLGNRKPKSTSELGDFGHLLYIPYCQLAIMEKDICNVLKQIQKSQDVISETEVQNISFLRELVED